MQFYKILPYFLIQAGQILTEEIGAISFILWANKPRLSGKATVIFFTFFSNEIKNKNFCKLGDSSVPCVTNAEYRTSRVRHICLHNHQEISSSCICG